MPDWYYDLQLSWLIWWHNHPMVWGSALFAALGALVLGTYISDVRKLGRR